MRRGLGGDVTAGVARADHQHALALQHIRRLVVRGVERLAGELPWILGKLGVPVVAVADDETAIAQRFARAVRGSHGDVPTGSARHRLDPLHRGTEADVWTQAEMVRVGTQIREHLLVARVVRPVLRHREVGVLGQRLGRDEMRRAADAAARLTVIPIAADIILALVHIVGDAELLQILGSGDAR
jgi:hypothetical protein